MRNIDEKASCCFHRCFLLAWLAFEQLHFYMDFYLPECYLFLKYIYFFMLQPILPRLACCGPLFVKAVFYLDGVIMSYLQSQTLLGWSRC